MRRIFWIAVVAGLTVVAVCLLYVSIQIARQSDVDEAQAADVILVLGAAEYRGRPSPVFKARLDHALDLYQRKLSPRILTTGGSGGDPDFTEGGVGRAYLIGRNVPSEAIIVEPEGESTAHSIAAAGEIMQRMSLRSCIVVSDGYHIYRVKNMLERRGMRVYGSPRRSHGRGEGAGWWTYLREAAGYLLWAAGLR
ncbi:MAG: YdcF family protein [Acidobacteria bacterium]|nr:YdcF family protein [Acidobacteriota bacterium]